MRTGSPKIQTEFPRLAEMAALWHVDEEALRRFLSRRSRADVRDFQRRATGGLSVKLAHLVAALHTLQRPGRSRPTRGEVENQMRRQGFAPQSGHVSILDLSYNAPYSLGGSAGYPELARFDKRTQPCRVELTKAGRAWFARHGETFLRLAGQGRLPHTIGALRAPSPKHPGASE